MIGVFPIGSVAIAQITLASGWFEVVEQGETWTEVSAQSETWVEVTAQSETWTEV